MRRTTRCPGASSFPVVRTGVLVGLPLFALWIGLEIGGHRATIVVDEVGQFVAALAAAVMCWGRSRSETGGARRGWALLAASALAWTLGQIVWSYYDVLLGTETPFPSLADIGFLSAVPLAVVGLASFRPTAGTRASLRTILDGVLVACSVLFVSWVLVLGPLFRTGTGSVFTQVLSLAYPVGDVVTITTVVIVTARLPMGRVRRSLGLVAVGLTAIAVADTLFAWFTQLGTFAPGSLFDIGRFTGFALIVLGAAHPGRPASDIPPLPVTAAEGGVATYLVFVPGAVALAVALLQSARGELDPALAFEGFALVGLLGARLIAGLRENVVLSRHLEVKVEERTAELREREARFAALVRRASDLVSIVTTDGVVLYQSPSIERTLGHRVEDVVGTDLTRLVHPDDRSRWRTAVAQTTARRPGPVVLEWRVWHTDGSWHVLETTVSNLLDEPSVAGIVLNARDVTERKALEEQLRHNAFHDPLTGLANRALFRDRLEHALATSGRSRRTVGVLYVDLDDFKAVNDTQGHDTGDELLVEVGTRLREVVRESDTVARFGGDEFALLIEHADGEAEAVRVAQRVIDTLGAPFETRLGVVNTGASIGIATGMAAQDAEELMRDADVAMYVAKTAGKGRYETFRPEMHEAVVDRIHLETDLRGALDREEFVVDYQPIVDVATNVITGVEALIRWMHPTRGLVPPLEFIPAAEATGLIVPIGAWLLRHTCAEVAGWSADDRPLSLSVNLSARQLRDDSIVNIVRDALDTASFAPERLTLEITESVLLDNVEATTAKLGELRSMGVKLAIDDFGTGYSSLAYLQRLPVDELKIDRSFHLAEPMPGAELARRLRNGAGVLGALGEAGVPAAMSGRGAS